MHRIIKYARIGISSLVVISLAGACQPAIPEQKPPIVEPAKPQVSKYEIFLLNNPEASEGFTPDEYKLALDHLKRTPGVMNDPEFHEAFNAKIKIEEDLLKNLGLYPPSELDWKEIILANWTDVYNRLYKNGGAYGSISKSGLEKRISNEKDRELYYMGLWVPMGLKYFSPSTDWSKWPNPDRLPYDMGPPNRSFVVENLKNLPTLASQIMQAYNDPDLLLHQRALYILNYAIPEDSFPNSKLTNDKYVQLYKESGDSEINLVRFVHGLTYNLFGGDLIGIEEILCKSLGLAVFEQRAPYGHGIPNDRIFTHGEPAIVVPNNILGEIKANPDKYGTPIIGPGQSIGWVPNYEVTGKTQDNIPFIEYEMPNSIIILKIDDKYDLSKKIELFRNAGNEPKIIERKDLK